jgi:hypothetical protein
MSTDSNKVRLLFAPYHLRPVRIGERVWCQYRERLVQVHGMSDARTPWLLCRPIEGKGRPGILVEDELARAIRCESQLALMYWWGASESVAHAWRKALGVDRGDNPGSIRLQRMNAEAGADVLRDVPLSPERVEQIRQSALASGRHPTGGVGKGRAWTAEELALLGTMPDQELAQQLGRSAKSITVQRLRQGKATCEKRPWTPEEDEILRAYLPPVTARKTGRTLTALYQRRKALGLLLEQPPFETGL